MFEETMGYVVDGDNHLEEADDHHLEETPVLSIEGAITWYRRLLASRSYSVGDLIKVGCNLICLGEKTRPLGIEALRRATKTDPRAEAYYWLATGLAVEGSYSEALVAVERGLELEETTEMLCLLIECLIGLARWSEAALAQEQLLKRERSESQSGEATAKASEAGVELKI